MAPWNWGVEETMKLHEAFSVIAEVLGDVDQTLSDGLPDGSNPEWHYDEELVVDIAEACERWRNRERKQL
jgi:hypothetical protein